MNIVNKAIDGHSRQKSENRLVWRLAVVLLVLIKLKVKLSLLLFRLAT